MGGIMIEDSISLLILNGEEIIERAIEIIQESISVDIVMK